MSLLDVDVNAPRRIEGITADGLRALGEIRERAKEIDKAADEMFEQRERRRQELDEQVKQAAAAQRTEEKPAEEAKPKPKRTLALGGDEFQQARAARQDEAPKPATPQPVPAEPAPPRPEPKPEPVRPNRTMKLGARDEDEAPAPPGQRDEETPRSKPEERPVRRPRPPRPEGDDDMSGRTWLR